VPAAAAAAAGQKCHCQQRRPEMMLC
jgi:hypothetical protein